MLAWVLRLEAGSSSPASSATGPTWMAKGYIHLDGEEKWPSASPLERFLALFLGLLVRSSHPPPLLTPLTNMCSFLGKGLSQASYWVFPPHKLSSGILDSPRWRALVFSLKHSRCVHMCVRGWARKRWRSEYKAQAKSSLCGLCVLTVHLRFTKEISSFCLGSSRFPAFLGMVWAFSWLLSNFTVGMRCRPWQDRAFL